jgi:methionyl-tRNA formyltransferase
MNPADIRIAFAGTPEFAAQALAALCNAGYTAALVLTQPDKPAGRGMKLTASPVKALAEGHALPLAQPRGLRLNGRHADDAAQAHEALRDARVQVLVVAAYGLILPQSFLDIPAFGCVNIHASLLPRWRGAAPIQRAIEAGDAQTGVTLMLMDAGLDTGAMLSRESVPISADETAASLHDKLANVGAAMIVRDLPAILAGTLAATAQPETGVTYAEKIRKDEARIDWNEAADVIERRLRAFDPFPGAVSACKGQDLKIWRGTVVALAGTPGTVLQVDRGNVVVACGEHALRLLEVQRPGGKRQTAQQWLHNEAVQVGEVLGQQ